MDLVENLIVEFPNGKVELSERELAIGVAGAVAIVFAGTYFLYKKIKKVTVKKEASVEIEFTE